MTDPRTLPATVRDDPRRRYPAMAVGGLAGLAVASAHWVGIVLGGALVGLAASDLKRALGAGAAYGLLVWLAFGGWLAAGGELGRALATGSVFGLGAAIAVLAGILGSLARGLA